MRWECSVSSGALGGFYISRPPPGSRSHSCPGWHRCTAAGGCPSGSRVCSAAQPVPRSLVLPEHPRCGFYRCFSFNHAALREHASVMLLTTSFPQRPGRVRLLYFAVMGLSFTPPSPRQVSSPSYLPLAGNLKLFGL